MIHQQQRVDSFQKAKNWIKRILCTVVRLLLSLLRGLVQCIHKKQTQNQYFTEEVLLYLLHIRTRLPKVCTLAQAWILKAKFPWLPEGKKLKPFINTYWEPTNYLTPGSVQCTLRVEQVERGEQSIGQKNWVRNLCPKVLYLRWQSIYERKKLQEKAIIIENKSKEKSDKSIWEKN